MNTGRRVIEMTKAVVAAMICNQCFRENFGKLGHRLVIEEGEEGE